LKLPRVKNRDIKFTNGSLFSVAFGWLHHAKSIDNCLFFQGEKRHFAGWLAIVCGFFGPALSVVFNLE